MSYIVKIWEQPAGLPLPDDAPAIWRMLDGLYERPAAQPNPKFLALGRQLMALYPEDPDGDEDGVWLDGGDGQVDEAVWNLGLYAGDRLDEVQAMVAARATALGLNLADEQADELYLADGRILARRPGAYCVRAFAAYFSGDHAAAWNAFLPLAEQGNRTATHHLATMVLRGEAGPKNLVLGHALLMLAGKSTEAARLSGHLRPEQQAAADALLARLQVPGQLQANVRQLTAAPPAGPAPLALQPTEAPAAAPPPTAAPAPQAPAVDIAALTRRATEGDRDARSELACQYKLGEGVPQSDAQALHWWQLAAEQGQADAQYNLALCYYLGDPVAKDETRAYKWFCQAVEGGHVEAIHNLGVMYEQGRAVARDPIASKALYLHARHRGYRRAEAPSFELGEASRAIALAARMAETGKVLEVLSAWRRSQAKAAAAPSGNRPRGGDAERPERDSGPDTGRMAGTGGGWHLGHLALLVGAFGLVLMLMLLPPGHGLLGKLLILAVELCAGYGAWRSTRDMMLGTPTATALVLLALVPGIGMFVCIGLLLKALRGRNA